MSRSVDRVRDYFRAREMPIEVRELPSSTRTAQLAAEAVGSELGQIVKSLVFVDSEARTVLALVAGDRRADPAKIASLSSSKSVRIANAEEVRARTGFAIGGVAPIAHTGDRIAMTLMDDSLLRYREVWAAAGSPNTVFPIGLDRLRELTGAQICEITVDVPQSTTPPL